MANFEAIFAGRILILSKNEGYGLQPVHKLSKISWASAPEGRPLCRFVLDLGVRAVLIQSKSQARTQTVSPLRG